MTIPSAAPPEIVAALRPALARVSRRRASLRLLVLAALGAVLARGLSAAMDFWGWDARWPWALLFTTIAATSLALLRRERTHPPDPRQVARAIERRDPSLRGLLLTAIAQNPATPEGRLGYLQQEVLDQAVARAEPRRWAAAAVPGAHAVGTAAGAVAAAALFTVQILAGLVPELASLWPDAWGIAVEPGSVEVERGMPVLVLARFGRQLPSRATLSLRVPGHAATSIEMQRNLDDPVFSAVTPAVDSDELIYQVEYAGRRTRRFFVRAFDRPAVQSVTARVSYPRGASYAARDINDARRLSVVEGATVRLRFTLNIADARAVLASDGGATIAARPSDDNPRVLTVTLHPDETRRWELRMHDAQGRPAHQPHPFPIEVTRNQPPQLRVTFPGRDVRLSPLEELSVEAEAEDDVGLLAWGLTYEAGGAAPREIRLGGGDGNAPVRAAPMGGPTRFAHLIALEDLHLTPGDLVTFHVWADDHAGDGRRRRTHGDLFFAEVRPFEEHYREAPSGGAPGPAQAGGGGAQEELAAQQREIVSATWRLLRDAEAGAAAEKLSADAKVVRTGQAEVATQARAAAEEAAREAPGGRARVLLPQAIEKMDAAVERLAAAEEADQAPGPAPDLTQALRDEQAALALLTRMADREHAVGRGNRSGGRGGGRRPGAPALSDLDLKQDERRYESQREARGEAEATRNEDRGVLARLKALAERQQEISAQINEARAALQTARDDQERQIARNRLQRLSDEQREQVDALDELTERMERPENRERMAEARGALERTRASVGEAGSALARGDPARAAGSSARAESDLRRARSGLQQKVAQTFSEDLRDLRARSTALDARQQETARAMAPALAPEERARLAARLEDQKRRAGALLDQMGEVARAAEPTAPLLARKLQDGLRKAKTDRLEDALAETATALEAGSIDEARAIEQKARAALGELDRGVGRAAELVLGDEAAALRRARDEVDRLMAEARAPAAGPNPGGDSGEPASPASNLRAVIDGLHDVEELVGRGPLADATVRLRERTRALRAAARQSQTPLQPSTVQDEIVRPLGELRARIDETLARIEPRQDTTPIDRDLVPPRYSDLVRRYYESLSAGP